MTDALFGGLILQPESALWVALMLCAMFVLDAILGEPKRWHPLVGFGHWARWLEARLNDPLASDAQQLIRGCLAWLIAVSVPLAMVLLAVALLPVFLQTLAVAVIAYFAIAARSLREHALAVAHTLPVGASEADEQESQGQLQAARKACGKLVSRDMAAAEVQDIASATVESVLENANDAVIAPLFWFMLAGLPGLLLFRLGNTLDAMWGYRNQTFLFFGRCAARVDDVLAYLPARLSVLLFALNRRAAWAVARRDGPQWYSPNSGPVMAAGAGALGLRLGGPASYHGVLKQRPFLGEGRAPARQDIFTALKLVYRSYLLLLLASLFVGVITSALT